MNRDYIETVNFKGIKDIGQMCKHCGAIWFKGAIEWHDVNCTINNNQREKDKKGKTCSSCQM